MLQYIIFSIVLTKQIRFKKSCEMRIQNFFSPIFTNTGCVAICYRGEGGTPQKLLAPLLPSIRMETQWLL